MLWGRKKSNWTWTTVLFTKSCTALLFVTFWEFKFHLLLKDVSFCFGGPEKLWLGSFVDKSLLCSGLSLLYNRLKCNYPLVSMFLSIVFSFLVHFWWEWWKMRYWGTLMSARLTFYKDRFWNLTYSKAIIAETRFCQSIHYDGYFYQCFLSSIYNYKNQ